MRHPFRRTWPQRLLIVVNVIAIAAALASAWALRTAENVAASIQRVQLEGALTPVVETPDGDRSFNVLLVGFDSSSNLASDDPVQIGRQGETNGDAIIVARIDEATETATVLSIPRDVWVPIAGRDESLKINAAFAIGGAETMVETIEGAFDIPVNHFMSVDFAGFQGLVDVVGHVEIFFERPARDFNENPVSGAPRSMTGFAVDEAGCQALDPVQALAYVRSRNYQTLQDDGTWQYESLDDTNDLGRIERQQGFLEALIDRAVDKGARNPFVLKDLIDEGTQHVTLDQDLSPNLLLDLGQAFRRFDGDQLQSFSLPTEFGWEEQRGRRVSVLNTVDRAAAPILALMRGAAPSDPATVDVRLQVDPERNADRETLEQALVAHGFLLAPTTAAPVEPSPRGITLRHGPDGAPAAQVLLDRLAGSPLFTAGPSIVVDTDLGGRTVLVELGPVAPPETPSDTPSTTIPSDVPDPSVSATVPRSPIPDEAALTDDAALRSCG